MLKWICGAPLAALVVTGCSLFQTAAVPDLPDPPEPKVNRFADITLPEQDEALPVYADPALDGLRAPALSKFRSEEEFLSWLHLAREASRARGIYWWRGMPPVAMSAPPAAEAAAPAPTSSAPPPPPPPPPSPAVSADSALETISVTGSTVPGSDENPEITNNQKAGVDEGSIVKQIGTHLVVLQDGRLFVTDLMPDGEAGLKLTDRANVYRSSSEDTWYDEILVAGRTILVTGYSYREAASEFTVLTLGEDGTVTRDATFYISSDDYYSGSNYATRMIDGKLVIHTPVYLSGRGWWNRFDPPVIREWRREEGDGFRERTELETGRPLFRAEDIWMPVQRLAEPVVHMVTVCDISGATDASAPACNATAIVGSETHEFLVTKDSFWLWLSPTWSERDHDGDLACEDTRAGLQDIAPSVLVRLPIDGSKPSVLSVRGEPQNQFSMDMDAGTFRAVLDWNHAGCGPWDSPDGAQLAFFDTPLDALSDVLEETAGGRYFDLPSPGTSDYEARFTEAHLVYGAREGWGSWPPRQGEPRDNGRAIIVPLDNPARPVTLELPHDVIRAERAGPYMALTGYHDHTGLSLSLIDLRAAPRLSGSLVLKGRFESENRSHAFNSRIDADGEGLIGLPTIPQSEEATRWWWWSQSSDLTYVAAAADGSLAEAGMLEATRADPEARGEAGYVCEVSCVDWYGNARPIFTGGRLLALLNSELIEGVLTDGKVTELRRIDLTAPLEK